MQIIYMLICGLAVIAVVAVTVGLSRVARILAIIGAIVVVSGLISAAIPGFKFDFMGADISWGFTIAVIGAIILFCALVLYVASRVFSVQGLDFGRRAAGFVVRTARYLWATKLRRAVALSTTVTLILVVVFVVVWTQYQASFNILHYDGNSWIEISSGTTAGLNDIWGISSSDIFAVGYEGTILHYDGSTWKELDSGARECLLDVWGGSRRYDILDNSWLNGVWPVSNS